MTELQFKKPSTLNDFLPLLGFVGILGMILSSAIIYKHSLTIGLIAFGISLFILIKALQRIFLFQECWQFDTTSAKLIEKKTHKSAAITKTICRFEDIAAFYVQGRQNRDRIRTWWNYRVVMLLNSGKSYNISDLFDQSPQKANELGRTLAQLVDSIFFAAQEEKVTRLQQYSPNISVTYDTWKWADVAREFWLGILVTAAMLATLIAFIIGLVFILS